MEIGKEITEAATQSSVQYRSNREALKKARLLEQREKNKEGKRMEKEAAAQKKKDEKEKERLEKAQAKKKAQVKPTTDDAEVAIGEGEGEQKASSKRRRGRGSEEIGEQDPGVLCNKFTGKEVTVVDSHEDFVKVMTHGSPVVWRARRAPLKKILELSEEFEQKEITKAPVALHADLKTFMESFVTAVQSDPNKIKSTRATSDDFQKFHDAFTLEHSMGKLLEAQLEEITRDPTVNRRSMILDRLHVHDDLEAAARGTEGDDGNPNRVADQEGLLWNKLHMVAHQHLHCFTGVINGLMPHLIFQMEGTKVISMVKIYDVPCQHMRFHEGLFGGGPFNPLFWIPRNRVGKHILGPGDVCKRGIGLHTFLDAFYGAVWGVL